MKKIVCLPLFFLFFLYGHTQEFFVAVNGADGNNGSKTRPFKTINRAIEEAAKLPVGDLKIYLRRGTYYLDSTIVLNNQNLKTKSLLIASFAGEQASISAGKLLKLNWLPYKNGILVADVPAGLHFEQLFINGRKQVLARYPNYNPQARVFNGTAADAIAPQRVRGWKHPNGGYVHGLHAGEWGGFHYLITRADAQGNLKLEGGWQNNRPSALHKQHRFVENIFEELDTAGEWFLNRETSKLYYYPPAELNLAAAKIEVSQFKNSIEIKGDEKQPLKNIELHNITFLHNERSFMYTKEPLLRSDWTIYRGGAVLLENVKASKITNCKFFGIGGNAVMVSGYNEQISISGNHIKEAGASGIAFVGKADAVRSPSFRYEDYVPYAKLDKTPGPKSNNYPQRCIAENNLIQDIGQIEKQATGVEIEIASKIIVRHNTIYNTPRAGINIGDGCFGGHILEYNDVFNTVLETGDHGAFNSWGRDRFWAANRKYMDSLVAIHPELILLDAQQTTIIRNNRCRCDHGWDIDLDDGSSNYYIYNNVCLNGGLKLREGFYRKVENNILLNNSFHPHVWFKNSGDVFKNNIVMTAYAPIGIQDWGKEIDRNFFQSKNDLDAAQKNNTDQHSLFGKAMFVDPTKGDYRVSKSSGAMQVGFRNFSMDSFGVQVSALKKIAAKPPLPELLDAGDASNQNAGVVFLGAVVRSVQGLGDRSAFGLPDETGVIILKLNDDSPLKTAGLQQGDVIRILAESPVLNTDSLKKIYQTSRWKGKVFLEAIRNQQPIKKELHLK